MLWLKSGEKTLSQFPPPSCFRQPVSNLVFQVRQQTSVWVAGHYKEHEPSLRPKKLWRNYWVSSITDHQMLEIHHIKVLFFSPSRFTFADRCFIVLSDSLSHFSNLILFDLCNLSFAFSFAFTLLLDPETVDQVLNHLFLDKIHIQVVEPILDLLAVPENEREFLTVHFLPAIRSVTIVPVIK